MNDRRTLGLERRIMKSFVQTPVAVFVMLILAVVYAAAQQPVMTATQTVSGYVLGPDDQILIRVIDAPDIPDKPVLIGTNGDITLPMIGRVKAGGLTVEQLETQLTTRLKEFIQEPQVSVTVTEFGSQPVSVFGAVNKPGVVQLRGQQMLYQVLSMAGGPRETAGSILTVTRPRQSGEIPLPGAKVDPTGQFSSVELNVQEILEGKNPAANIEIKPMTSSPYPRRVPTWSTSLAMLATQGPSLWGDNGMFPSSERCLWRGDSDARRRRTGRGSFATCQESRSPERSL